jgi:ABC-2 type transport system ATP-binding protein
MTEATFSAPAVRVEALTKRYGKRAVLRDVSLELKPGDAFGLVGANGAGKTTLIKCLLDLCHYQGGQILIFGRPAGRPQARERLAYVPERFVPPHYLRCSEFLEAMMRLAGGRYDRRRAEALFEALDLEPALLARPVRELSKGMTQKLGLAWCFLLERDLYVLDEPMSGLDPAARVAVKALMRRLHEEGRTLLFTSHVLADVDELCASIAVLDDGRLRYRGTPAGLRERYDDVGLEQAFMRCINDKDTNEGMKEGGNGGGHGRGAELH